MPDGAHSSHELLFAEAVRCYLGEAIRWLDDMKRALGRRDGPTLAQAAHSLAGSSAVLGARALAERCYEVEELAQSGDFETCARRLSTVFDVYRRVESDLRTSAA